MSLLFRKFFYSFPVQLLIQHIKRNQFLLLSWVVLVMMVTQSFGTILGVPYLFLDPEYIGDVGFLSFFIIGVAYGFFVVSFNITTYILYGSKFTFIGILSVPFIKFSLNNSLTPLIVAAVYIVNVVGFQINNEFTDTIDVLLMVLGFCMGLIITVLTLYKYFNVTNKDIFKYLTETVDKRLKKVTLSRHNVMRKIKESKSSEHQVEYYFDTRLKLRSTKGLLSFYDKDAVVKVFDQNHLNALLIQGLILFLILLSGFFVEVKYFQIPVAASALLLFTIITIVAGAISYWFRGWMTTILIALFVALNVLFQSGAIVNEFHALGLDYEGGKATFNLKNLYAVNHPDTIQKDKAHVEEILENWKSKQSRLNLVDSISKKPIAIFICTSGGGQRAALWISTVLKNLDDRLGSHSIMDRSIMISGASGGMIGAAYYRELLRRMKNGEQPDISQDQINHIAKDNLNPIIFSLLVNDLFMRFQRLEYKGRRYKKDRGYAFERQLSKNTDGILDKQLVDYKSLEYNAEVPFMLIGPTIANDGRKLYISTFHTSFMNLSDSSRNLNQYPISNVDFLRFFQDQDSENLGFLSALRLNASFPYITPNVSLPSTPPMVIMDAGVADNFGISDAAKFLYVFKDWFLQNTSKVILLSIRDTRKVSPIERQTNLSLVGKFSAPISSVYNNLANLQDINNDQKMKFIKKLYHDKLDVVRIEYDTRSIFTDFDHGLTREELEKLERERASLSWHLTTKEKNNIVENIKRKENKVAVEKLMYLLGEVD